MARLLLVTSIFPPEAGGPATFISALAPALRDRGHQVRVFTLWDSPPPGAPDWLFGLSRRIPVLRRLALIFLKLLRHVAWAEVVYINGLELPAALACKTLRRPCIMKIVGDYAWERARTGGATRLDIDPYQQARLPLMLEVQRRLRGWYCRAMDIVVTPSRYLEGLVAGWGVKPEKSRMVLNGLTPLPESAPDATEPPNRGLVVTAARLVDWKGVDHLLEALSLMESPARLSVLGDGPQRAALEARAEALGLTDRVEFAGRVGRAEVLARISRSDVFVLASGYEGLPHVALEAMAMGRPVVAAACGGTPEVVMDGQNGLLAPYARPRELARALDRLLADPDLAAKMGRQGLETARRFDWNRTVAGHTELIESLVPRIGAERKKPSTAAGQAGRLRR